MYSLALVYMHNTWRKRGGILGPSMWKVTAKPYSCKLMWKKIIEKQPEKEIYSCTKRN